MALEAVHDRPNLKPEHAELHEAIRWISLELYQIIQIIDDVAEVFGHGWERDANQLHRERDDNALGI